MFSLLTAAVLVAAPVTLPATVVRHDDLDLTTAHGRAQLDHRIMRAAQRVCQPESRLTPQLVASARRCFQETVAATRPDRDRVVAAHAPAPIMVAVR